MQNRHPAQAAVAATAIGVPDAGPRTGASLLRQWASQWFCFWCSRGADEEEKDGRNDFIDEYGPVFS